MLELSTVLKQSTNQVSCNLNDEIAILNLDKTVYFGLEGVGAAIWQALEQPRSVANICQLILDDFEVAPTECEADVVRFLNSMQDAGLIEVAE